MTGLHATYRLDQDFCVRRAQYVLLIMYNNKNIRSRRDSNPQPPGLAPKCGALDRSATLAKTDLRVKFSHTSSSTKFTDGTGHGTGATRTLEIY